MIEPAPASGGYPCEGDLLEIMFAPESRTRLVKGSPTDLSTDATADLDGVLGSLDWYRWSRISQVGEEELDRIRSRGEKNSGLPLYDLNNIYHLRIPPGQDIWDLAKQLESLAGIHRARPVPLPVKPPLPSDYQPQQKYLDPGNFTPTGIDAEFAWNYPGGNGWGITVCDLEYNWNYNHADVTKGAGSQINADVVDPGYGPDHGTAVIGEMVADDNGWGITGICHKAELMTCGTFFGVPTPSWNVPGALAVAIANLQPGDVILLENQWDYSGQEDFVPIEWWTDYYPSPQTYNAVYAAIQTAVANGIHVVETGGNGEGDSGTISWYGDSGAIVVGAGGAYPGGTWTEGDLQKLSFSTYGPRFDLQGWGEDVVTTGFGDLYGSEGPDYYFTSQFSGTSAAGPIVAGAVAACSGFWKANVSSTPASPSYLRDLLKSTGTPQVTPPAGNIGPRPNLRAALEAIGVSDVPTGGMPSSQVVLQQNYPNPLNPETRITFSIQKPGYVKLTIHDASGRRVETLLDGHLEEGTHHVTWDGRNASGGQVSSGVYFYRLETGNISETKSMVLVK